MNYKYFDCLESTNTTAKELAAANASHATVVVAGEQTGGRGRGGKGFFSPPDSGIYMSIVLTECLGTGLITPLVAVAVCESLESVTGKSPQIKWVNDLFLDRKKVCGILCESGGNASWTVAGIGINLTPPESGFPEEIRESAGSVYADFSQIPDNIDKVKDCLIHEITRRVLDFCENPDSFDINEYRRRLMWLGEDVQVLGNGEPFTATVIDADESGRLIVRKDCGEEVVLSCGSICEVKN
ncbi:MAG: biotin--[acetyl-CoA-carboxylase] ligase [Oscillospiraceae bacterium]|nr:biotin--[acetyl-CoA-carboxylase] ligase [Oscillospiraceae bacterium]